MKRFSLFRSNLKNLESYHKFNDIENFEKECWDFYLMMGIEFLKLKKFDEVVVWRFSNKKIKDKVFIVNKRKFIQRWIQKLDEVFDYPKSEITLFRGGFPEYCKLTLKNKNHFGLKLYLGASFRTIPQYGGHYDKVLVESDLDLNKAKNSIPFYKTANDKIFYSFDVQPENKSYDICWPCNFTQIRHKGQEFFIRETSKSKFLRSLKIVHCGNNPKVGFKLCKKYNISNISFMGHTSREELNIVLNESKFGLVTSNINDGCPRVSTEILSSECPLLIRSSTRFLSYYKSLDQVFKFNDQNISEVIKNSFKKYNKIKKKINLDKLSMKKICEMNFDLWLK